MVALSLTKAKYIALILVKKKTMWLRLFLTKLGLFEAKDQHVEDQH